MYAAHEQGGGGHSAVPPAASTSPSSMSSHEQVSTNVDTCNDSTNDALRVPVDLSQTNRFTEQDEARELATLTIQDLFQLQSDLTGVQSITNGMSGMGFGTGSTSTDVSKNSASSGVPNVYRIISPDASSDAISLSDQGRTYLAALEQQMSALPQSTTEVYNLAQLHCPDEVSPRKKLQFLECEDNDVGRAAIRMAKYWNLRRDLYGDDKCFQPMTLGGSMKDEVMNMAQRKVFQLLPHTDMAGRGIILECWGHRDFARYTTRQEFRALVYLLHILMQDDDIRQRGYVILVNGANTSGRQFSRDFPKYLQWVDAALPLRMRAAHICNASPVMHYLILPTVKRFVPRDVRLRGKLHRGSAEELLRYLAEYNLPSDRVPAELGGSVLLDVNQFLIDRISLEAASAGIPLSPTATAANTIVVDIGTNNAVAAAAVVSHSGSMVTTSISTKRQRTAAQKNTKKPRNVMDPRMARAVKAKQDNADMTLYDALVLGGFHFEFMKEKKNAEIFDEEGISLKQVCFHMCIAVCACVFISFSSYTFLFMCLSSCFIRGRTTFSAISEG